MARTAHATSPTSLVGDIALSLRSSAARRPDPGAASRPSANTAPEKPAPISLPHRLERMVGREDILKDLSARMLRDRFVTLRGPGGIGKTTVAVALAHDMLAAFEGHVDFLDLGPLKDATLVASSVAAAVGLVVHHADPTDSIIAFLRDRRLLLVLDGCEHVIDVVAGLAENIHQRAPNVSILATSRESLLVQGEQIFELVPLRAPPQGAGLSVSEALSYPAVRLFMERATAAGHRADLTDDDADVLAEICGKLDGIALAIELAAVRVGVHGLREVAALLDGRLKLEWRGRRTAPPRHQTLGATLDWSYGLIDESERTRCGVWPFSPAHSRCKARLPWRRRACAGRSSRRCAWATRRQVAGFGAAGWRLDTLSPARHHQGLCHAEAGRLRRGAGHGPPACRLRSAGA